MNGSQIKAVIDTNVIFMSLYNPESKAGKIIKYAIEGKIHLFSTDTVKEEIKRVLKRELFYNPEEISLIIESLPITWIVKEIYSSFLSQTKVKHKPDKPIEALSLALGCGILSADFHFKNVKSLLDVNEFLRRIK